MCLENLIPSSFHSGGCRDPLGRPCCISPGKHTRHSLVRFVCRWSHVWALFQEELVVLSNKDPKPDIYTVWMLSRPGQSMTWGTKLLHGADVHLALPRAAPGSKAGRAFPQQGQWKGRVPSSVSLLQAKGRCSTGSIQPFLHWLVKHLSYCKLHWLEASARGGGALGPPQATCSSSASFRKGTV